MQLVILIGLFMPFLGIQIFSIWALKNEQKKQPQKITDWPKVSILLAARNEEVLILRNLNALNELDYPKDKIEILIGDDSSTDNTHSLVKTFIQDKPEFQLFSIEKRMGKAKAKANVLAHLAHHASADFYFITDVDVKVPPNWIRGMLQQFNQGIGIVSGTTKCERGNLVATLQGVDWLHFMGYIKAFASKGVGCTSVGNNMAVRAEAYWQTGGYENIDFSITEDYKLFKEVTKRGWGWSNELSPDTLGLASYIPEITSLLHQRKRWLIGARELPINWKSMLMLYGAFYPALIWAILVFPQAALAVFLLKFLIQSWFILTLLKKAERPAVSWITLLIYEVYVWTTTLLTAIFYILPLKSRWKGRTY